VLPLPKKELAVGIDQSFNSLRLYLKDRVYLSTRNTMLGEYTLKDVYEIQQFLKRYGTIIYVGHRLADLELMEEELIEMSNSQLIETKEFQNAIMLLRHEIQLEKEKNNRKMGER
jgi:uncharacterized protein YqgQ